MSNTYTTNKIKSVQNDISFKHKLDSIINEAFIKPVTESEQSIKTKLQNLTGMFFYKLEVNIATTNAEVNKNYHLDLDCFKRCCKSSEFLTKVDNILINHIFSEDMSVPFLAKNYP